MLFRVAIASLFLAAAARAADKPLIRLNSGVIDTDRPDIQARQSAAGSSAGRRLHLVQWDGPIQPAWVDALTASGVQVIDYIPDNSYLVYGTAGQIQSMRRSASGTGRLRWTGSVRSAEKIHPAARRTATNPQSQTGTETFGIQLVHDPEANAETLGLIEAFDPGARQRRAGKYVNIIANLPADAIDGLAEQADIISVIPYVPPRKFDERQAQIVAGNTMGNQPAGPGYLDWLGSMGFSQEQFTASGFVVNITDSGIDNGSTNANHTGLRSLGGSSGASRVVYNRLEGEANPGSTLAGCDGHGTINAHILAGYSNHDGFPHADSAGFRYGLGVAPFVKLGSSVIFDPDNFTFPNYSDLISRAYQDGARISSDSWGTPNFGLYDFDAQEYDALVRDAQPAGAAISAEGNQEMTIVFAAGNAGPGIQTIGSPGTGKNVITIGASENVQSHATTNGGNNASGNDGCNSTDARADNFNDIAEFSSRGPTADSRKKPELVAPGTHVSGGVPQAVLTTNGLGSNITCFSAAGICALEGGRTLGSTNNYFPLGQRWYTTSSGTSHATPAAAAAAALVRQHFINQGLAPPSPAMTKAYLVNGARYLTGASANDSLWSNSQGMGGLDLSATFDQTPRLLRDQSIADRFTASGQSRSYTVAIASNDRPFRITLSWTDAPGSTIGAAYNNDINLSVTINGNLYRGNVFSGAYSVSGGSADPRNNTECVFLPVGTTGIASIVVSAFNINSDGVPNEGSGLDQDFALVAYNAIAQLSPLIVNAGASLETEDCAPGNNMIDPGEYVTIALALANEGTAPASNLTATLLGIGGVTIPSEPVAIGLLSPGDPPVTNMFAFTAAGNCGDTITVTLSLADGENDLGTVSFPFAMGEAGGSINTNANTGNLPIPAVGKAIPYPSTNTVFGITGLVEKVTVTFSGFSHTYPEDLDILLVGPSGQSVVLMSGAGGSQHATNVTITFDDNSSMPLPDQSQIQSGTYKPSWYIPALGLESPAPPPPYGDTLSVFNGTSPNGDWKLYIYDVEDGDEGNLSSGWRLHIMAGQPVCCEQADTDGDNMPDAWEMRQFGDLVTAEAGTDSDDDHVSDLDEFLSGTQPTNAHSFLGITDGGMDAEGGFVVAWPGVPGKYYSIARTTNLSQSPFLTVATNIAGVRPANVFTVSPPAAAETHYRVRTAP